MEVEEDEADEAGEVETVQEGPVMNEVGVAIATAKGKAVSTVSRVSTVSTVDGGSGGTAGRGEGKSVRPCSRYLSMDLATDMS